MREAFHIARKRRVHLTKRFYINAALFCVLLIVGFLFRSEYVAVRNAIRSELIDTAKTIAGDIRDSDVTFTMPSLRFGANSERLTGRGEQIDTSDTNAPANTGSALTFPSVMYPYRALLNADAQAIYNQVYANALAKNAERFTLVQPVSEDVLSDIMNAVYNDHPELFWVDTAYSYGFVKNGSIVTVTLTFNDTIAHIEQAEAAFSETVDKVVQAARQYATDIEREKFVHDYLMQRVNYDVSSPMNQSAYSALVSGASVCAGYSRAFQHLLMRLDIPCYYVTGTAAGGDHAWNIIALGSDFYNVDPSWDDAAGTAYGTLDYSYFNVPDSQFSADHTRSAMSALLPACNGTLMRYSAVYGDREEKPAANVTTAKLPTYASLGFGKNDILGSLSAYNAYCFERLTQLGTGTHTLTMVLQNAALMRKVSEAAESDAYVEGYAQAVVNTLRLSNCRISLQLSFENLADGYILLRQTVALTGEPIAAATATPTIAPTPAPTVVIAPIPTEAPSPAPTEEPVITPPPYDTPAPIDTAPESAFSAPPETSPYPAA